MKLMTGSVVLIVTAVALGCASTPNPNYYTLDMLRSGNVMPAVNIEVSRIRPSEAVARDGIMILQSQTQIEYYAVDRWVSNVGELVKEKLETEFGPPIDGAESVQLTGDILRFGQVDTEGGADAQIRMLVAVTRTQGPRRESTLLRKRYESRVDAGSASPGDVVLALSRGLEAIAAEIAADVQAAIERSSE